MAPALVAVGSVCTLLAWNEYQYPSLCTLEQTQHEVPVALAQLRSSDQAP